VKALAIKLAAKGNELRFCYEAGPCSYASSGSSVGWNTNGPSSLRHWSRENRESGSRLTVGVRSSLPSCTVPTN
jgi:hypothetical protein